MIAQDAEVLLLGIPQSLNSPEFRRSERGNIMRMMAWLGLPGLGSLPERTELHPVITGIVEHDEINQQTSNKRRHSRKQPKRR